jgi:hypothetical protein
MSYFDPILTNDYSWDLKKMILTRKNSDCLNLELITFLVSFVTKWYDLPPDFGI